MVDLEIRMEAVLAEAIPCMDVRGCSTYQYIHHMVMEDTVADTVVGTVDGDATQAIVVNPA